MLKRIVLLNTIVIALIVTIMCYCAIKTTTGLIYEELETVYGTIVDNGDTMISSLFADARSNVLAICTASETQALFSSNPRPNSTFPAESWGLASIVSGVLNNASYCTLHLYTLSGDAVCEIDYKTQTVFPVSQAAQSQWYTDALSAPTSFAWEQIYENGKYMIRIAKVALSTQDWKTPLGVVALDLNMDYLRSSLFSFQISDFFFPYFISSDGSMVFPATTALSIPPELLQSPEKSHYTDESGNIIYIRSTGLDGLKLICQADNTQYLSRAHQIRSETILLGVLLAVLSLIISGVISYSVSTPITRLSRFMVSQEQTNTLGVTISPPPRGTTKEVKQLYDSFNQMIESQEQIMYELLDSNLKAKDAQLRATEANLMALQAQINPHFLYNTLDSISWMSMKYNAYDISESIQALAKMFRYALNNGCQMISLYSELEQVKNYVSIMQIRYPDTFVAQYEVDSQLMTFEVTKLLLQPLVENAISHGFRGSTQGGRIILRGTLDDTCSLVQFEVRNNGLPITPAKITDVLYPPEGTKPKSYGLRNVNDRLITFYGPEHKLRYFTEGEWSVFAFTLPYPTMQTKEAAVP